MNGVPWSQEEREHLMDVVGDVPGPRIRQAYNTWARLRGYALRSEMAIQSQISRMRLSRKATGEWIGTAVVAATLGIDVITPKRWCRSGILPSQPVRCGQHVQHYVRRLDLVAFARSHPQRFAGVGRSRLVMLLEDEQLADAIAAKYPKRGPRRRPVRCVETGRVFPSVRDAARAHFVINRAITQAIETGQRSAGFHWTDASYVNRNAS